ncbi:MAG: LutB/LldF family L-lactate oxidation iron-sulfur protein [Syntrophales bacterium]|nr:LutB/LldF family L-lactate oxidation iron-sulfur protein [Syntrophales bacterium]
MKSAHPRIDFRANTRSVSPKIAAATQKNAQTALRKRAEVVAAMGEENWENLRNIAHDMKLHTITHLDRYLSLVEEKVTAAGGIVHWARDAEEANRIVLEIARRRNVKKVVKVKSMVSEELEINHVLEKAGIRAFETDLGEYIVQMAGQRPSHVTNPALHMTKEDIAELFREKLHVDVQPDPKMLTEIARERLRAEFLTADMGISGGNFLVAETGTLVLVTNEGNGRMCTSLPPVHVAIVGIEKIVPDWESAAVLLKLLARSATGAKITAYNTFVTGRWEGGPEEFHLILLDNGRTRVLADEMTRETLFCIRCGACMNICPVFNQVGGHAYGATYPGPIGAILTPQLLGSGVAGGLPFASTLCGACAEACPVKIPIPNILLHLRGRVLEGDRIESAVAPAWMRVAAKAMRFVLGTKMLYLLGARLNRVLQAPLRRGDWIPWMPAPLNRWTMARPFPAFRGDFRKWWRNREPGNSSLQEKKHER